MFLTLLGVDQNVFFKHGHQNDQGVTFHNLCTVSGVTKQVQTVDSTKFPCSFFNRKLIGAGCTLTLRHLAQPTKSWELCVKY
jgi:hypothetical protein